MVRTKTGNKIHLAFSGSSRTLCGVRYAAIVRAAKAGSQGCELCGVAGNTIEEMNARWAVVS